MNVLYQSARQRARTRPSPNPFWVPVWVRSPWQTLGAQVFTHAGRRDGSRVQLWLPLLSCLFCHSRFGAIPAARSPVALQASPPPPPPRLHFASGSAGALEAGALKSNAPDWGAGRNKISGTLNFQTTFTEIGFERTPPESVAVQSPLKQGPKSID